MMVLDAKDWLDVFPALDDVDRFNMLILLNNEGPLFHREIAERRTLSASRVTHHLNRLMDTKLIKNEYVTPQGNERLYSRYQITEKGEEILRILFP